VKELVQSEQAYFCKLDLVCTKFLIPLSAEACSQDPFLTMNDVRTLFSCVARIKSISFGVLSQLPQDREKDRNPNFVCVGPIFLSFVSLSSG
jgi:hypothetical protein